jgi:nitrous oxide reductase
MSQKIPIIHLMRKNLVKQIISGLTAATTKHNPVMISGKELLRMVKEAHKLNKYWSNQLKNQIKLTLYYEDIIGKTEGDRTYMASNANIAVCNFFGIPQVQLYAKTKKKNKEDLSVYLPNIEDIKKVFKETKFKWMI